MEGPVSRAEQVKLRLDKMRQEREQRQADRIQLLKNLHLQRVVSESPFLIGTNFQKNNSKNTTKVKNAVIDKPKQEQTVSKTNGNYKPATNDLPPKSKKINLTHLQNRRSTFVPLELKTKEMGKTTIYKKRQTFAGTFKNEKSLLHGNLNECDYKFNTTNNLKTHQKIFTDTKQNIRNCTISNKFYDLHQNTKKSIKDPILVKTTDFICPKPVNTHDKMGSTRISCIVGKKINVPSTQKTVTDTFLKKTNTKQPLGNEKLRTKTNNEKIVTKNNQMLNSTSLISNNQNKTLFRRSLSTVHFKRLGTDATKDCFKRTKSFSSVHNKEIEEILPQPFPPKNYVLTVKSERKKSVTFFTPCSNKYSFKTNPHTPQPNELRKKLNDWLQKRGKSLSTYHHLQCFGIEKKPVNVPINDSLPIMDRYIDDENKENIEIDDNDSFDEHISGNAIDYAADSRSKNNVLIETNDAVCKKDDSKVLADVTKEIENPDSLINGVLCDLNHLILENYSWVQCAEWLRAIVNKCGDNVKTFHAYWECRAALEQKRGDFMRTLDCFSNALKQGADVDSIEESLDNLLQKFMKLNLDAACDENRMQMPNKKLIDVKNVFKSTLIKFAIKKQTDLKNDTCSNQHPKKYVATPVRRSTRITTHTRKENADKNVVKKSQTTVKTQEITQKAPQDIKSSSRKHLIEIHDSLRNLDENTKQMLVFVPNKALDFNDCI